MRKFLLLLLFVLLQNSFAVTTYYVKTDGDDANSGLSWSLAKRSIQSAHDASAADDVILVKYGTYNLTNCIYVNSNRKITSDDGNGSTWDNADYNREACILSGSSSSNPKLIQMTATSINNGCVIRGFKITGSHGTYDCAVGIWDCSPIIEHCWFYDNSSRGFYCKNASPIVRSNIFQMNDCALYALESHGAKIYNNFLFDHSNIGLAFTKTVADVYNNTIVDCTNGIVINNDNDIDIINNIFVSNSSYAVNSYYQNNSVRANTNRFWKNNHNYFSGQGSAENSSYSDPCFVETGSHPYSLKDSSDCVNEGYPLTSTDVSNKDVISNSRFYNAQLDMGAYEFQGNPLIFVMDLGPDDGGQFCKTYLEQVYMRFNHNMRARGGSIGLYAEGGTLIKQLPSTSADVVVNGKEVFVTMNQTLTLGVRYYMNVGAAAFDDGHDTWYSGIANDQDWDWTIKAPDWFPGNALDFDGVDDYVVMPDQGSLDLRYNYTLEAWFKPQSFGSMKGLISKYQTSGADGYYLRLTSTGDYTGLTFDGMSTANGLLLADQWYHVAAVCDDKTRRLYLNGVEQPLTGTPTYIILNSDDLRIGSDFSDRYFNGSIDEVRIWKTPRSQQQIRENMHRTIDDYDDNLAAYWQLNQTSGDNAWDSMRGVNGKAKGMTDGDWTASPIPTGGGTSSSQSIAAGFTGSVDFADADFAMQVHSKTETESFTMTKINWSPNTTPPGVSRIYDSQYWVLHKYGAGAFDSDFIFTLGEDLGQDVEDQPSLLKLYRRDGNAVGDWTLVASAGSCNAAANSATFPHLSADGQYLICRMTGAAQAVAGKMLNFNGSNANVTGSGLPTEFSQITLSSWVYHRTLEEKVNRYVTLKNEVAVIRYDGTSYGGPGEIHFYIKTGGVIRSLRSENVLTTNKWQHVAGTWDGATMKIYLNGQVVASKAQTGPMDAGNGNFQFASTSETLDGYLDEARIYDTALSEQQIRESMHLTLHGDEAGLAAYWQMNEGAGFATTEDVIGGYSGALNSMDISNDWLNSTVPLGGGTSASRTVSAVGSVDFTGTGLSANFTAKSGSDDLTVTKINNAPNALPVGKDAVFDDQYWVINKYGSGTFNAQLVFTVNEDLTNEDAENPGSVKLFKRDSGSVGDWYFEANASSVNALNNSAVFNNISSCSQYVILRDKNLADVLPGRLLDFDGTGDYAAASGLPLQLNKFTIEAWVYHRTTPSANQRYVTLGDNVAVIQHSGAQNPGDLDFYIRTSGGTHHIRTSGEISTDRWIHVAGTWDGTDMVLYCNGKSIFTWKPAATINTSDGTMKISHPTETMNGYIDEVRIWNVVRTMEQIRETMHQTPKAGDEGLVSYYQLNSTSGLTVLDVANGIDGTLTDMSVEDWLTSTTPIGKDGSFVVTTTPTSAGPAGGSIGATITSVPNNDNNLGIYQQGGVNEGRVTDENFPSGITQRANILWGVVERGGVTSTLVFNYSNVNDIADPAGVHLLKRADCLSPWTEVTSDYVHDVVNRTFTKAGVTDYSEFSLGLENPIVVELTLFEAVWQDGAVKINWRSVTEANVAGYHIFRSLSKTEGYEKVNSQLIAVHESNASGEYHYIDRPENQGLYYYKLEAVLLDGTTEFHGPVSIDLATAIEQAKLPETFALFPNFPNPFNSRTTIEFALPKSAFVTLNVYNLRGEQLTTLVAEQRLAGIHRFNWDAEGLASGVYLYRLEAEEFVQTRKLILMR